MKPSPEIIERFQKTYFEEFGEEISREIAYEKFLNLTTLLRVILYPSKNESKVDQNNENDKLKYHKLNKFP